MRPAPRSAPCPASEPSARVAAASASETLARNSASVDQSSILTNSPSGSPRAGTNGATRICEGSDQLGSARRNSTRPSASRAVQDCFRWTECPNFR